MGDASPPPPPPPPLEDRPDSADSDEEEEEEERESNQHQQQASQQKSGQQPAQHDSNTPVAAAASGPTVAQAIAVAAPAQTGSTKKSPSDFLKTVLGRPVVVKLNSGIDYRGEGGQRLGVIFHCRVLGVGRSLYCK